MYDPPQPNSSVNAKLHLILGAKMFNITEFLSFIVRYDLWEREKSQDTQFSTVKGKLKINREECGTLMSVE